jgi:hypothetical protein
MQRRKAFFVAVFSFTVAWAWGGASGPQTMPIQGAHLVADLHAVRTGNRVMLSWSQPREASDPQSPVHHPLVARLCRTISSRVAKTTTASSTSGCTQALAEIDPDRPLGPRVRALKSNGNGEVVVHFVDTLPEDQEGLDPRQFALYTVELRDKHGRSAGFSDQAAVSLAPVLPAKGLHSELDSRGVYLIWENDIESRLPSLQFDYQLYRQEKGRSRKAAIPYLRAIVHSAEGDRWSGVDTNIEWDKTYVYWVIPVTRVYSDSGKLLAEIRGDDPAPLEVTTHDVFPPAVPERLLGMVSHGPGNKFVDLIWAPNAEKDLAGYNIYRREEGGTVTRINSEPVTMLSFQDNAVAAGRRYLYCLSAVDVHGNESAKSPEIAEAIR